MSADAFGRLTVRGDIYAEDMQKSLIALAAATKKSVSEVIKGKTDMMGEYLAHWTMPRGLNKESRDVQENAVIGDIGRVYLSAAEIIAGLKAMHSSKTGDAMARGFSKAARSGNVDEARQIMRRGNQFKGLDVMMFDGGAKHRSSQRNGRVSKYQKPVVVLDPKKLREYITEKRKMAGWTKAGWVNAARQITGKGKTRDILSWVSRHTSAPAVGTFKSDGVKSEAKLTNNVFWVSKKINEGRAMTDFDNRLRQFLVKALEGEARKAQRMK